MPIVQIHMLAGRDVEKKRLLAKRITETVQEVLGSPPEKIRVMLRDMPHDSYSVGGVLYCDEDKT